MLEFPVFSWKVGLKVVTVSMETQKIVANLPVMEF